MVELAQVQGLDGTHMLSAAAWKGFEGTPDLVVLYRGGRTWFETGRAEPFGSSTYVRFEPS